MDASEFEHDLEMLTFIATYECGAKCSHCLMSCGPERHEKLSLAQMKYAIDRVFSGRKGVVVFTGGECTRLGNDLLEAIAYANTKGLMTRVVSNAEWAFDDVSTDTMIKSLRESGLDELNLSFDDFHAEWIPVENVRRAWLGSKNQGFTSVALAAGSGPASILTPESAVELFDEDVPVVQRTRPPAKLPDPSPDGTSYVISPASYSRIGRGRGLDPAQYLIPNQKMIYSCPCAVDTRSLVISPEFEVGICCGLNPHGNTLINRGSFYDFSGLDDWSYLFLEVAESMGPGYFIDLIKRKDPSLDFSRSEYGSICEMCEDISRSPEAQAILKSSCIEIRRDLDAEKHIESVM